jgi:PPM family protein phosphatase
VLSLIKEAVQREDLTVADHGQGISRTGILLRDAIHRANQLIHHTSKTQSNCEGMGTTIVAGLFFDDRLTVAHVGDSRLYRWRAGQLEQITQDHSLLQELVSRGFYSPQEAARAASKNYVTRALGVETSVDVDIRDVDVQPGDLYLLCSDGLSDMVEDEDIHLTISTFGANLETLARQLVLLSNDNGGRDNVSIVLVRVNDSFPARRGLVQRFRNLFN